MPKPIMTSRERVLRTLNHQEPDRVPFNLALTVDIYNRLRQHLGLPPDPDAKMGIWTDVALKFDLIEAMQVDICAVGLNPPANWSPPPSRNGLVYDEWGIGRRKVVRDDGSFYLEMVEHPLANATLEDVRKYPWPDPFDSGRTQGLRQKVKRIRDETDKAIMAKFSNSIWEQAWWLRGLEQWMMDLALNPEIACAIMDKVCEVAVGTALAGLEVAGDLIDIYRLSGEDLGTQLNPMISPKMFERLVRPRFERLWSSTKRRLLEKNPAGKLMLHSCGNVRPFIPSWIDMGLDILDPIQPRAQGMGPGPLKRDFGDRLTFHGGIDLQQTLPFGSVEDVANEVRDHIHALAPGGGYIVAPAHNVQGDVPPRNLVAIRDAIKEHGCYPVAV
jgi:uroporphyrinogen decarboxylase